MRYLTSRLGIALLTFSVGVATATLWLFLSHSLTEDVEVTLPGPIPAPSEQEGTGRFFMGGEGISEDGHPTSFVEYELPDGRHIHQESVFYKSPRRANAALHKRLEEAVEIVRREPVMDEKGRRIGERVVATFGSDKGARGVWAELLWTEGRRYVSKRGYSLESILEALDSKR